MTTIESIAHFCAPNDGRTFLQKPHVHNGRIIASDGVWIAALDPGTTLPDGITELYGFDPSPFLSAMDSIYPTVPIWIPATAIGVQMQPCGRCCGKGTATVMDCDDCDGEGEFAHGRHTYDCQECGGIGTITHPGIGNECVHCHGTGKTAARWTPSTAGDGGYCISGEYVARLRRIDGEFDTRLHRGYDGKPFFIFRFPGGRGYLMPARHETPLAPHESDICETRMVEL